MRKETEIAQVLNLVTKKMIIPVQLMHLLPWGLVREG